MRRLIPRRLAPGEEAPLVDHLGELRARLVWCLVAVGGAFIVTFTFNNKIIGWLNRPLDPDLKPTTFAVAEPFITTFMISLWAAVAIAMPIILWQLWSFFAPAIHEHTQRMVLGFVAFATALFLGGLFFAYFVALPASIQFLTNFNSDEFDIQLRARDYYTFVLWVLIALSVVFELPIFVLALARLGILPSHKLRRNRRIGYVAVTALAVAMPGVDPVTLLFTMTPLLILFELSIWMTVFFDRRWKRAAAAREAAFEAGADTDA
jgi:sec-independent protein translocase protein TatC